MEMAACRCRTDRKSKTKRRENDAARIKNGCLQSGRSGKSKKWYTAVLGFEPYFDQPFYVGYKVGGFELGLDPDMEGVTRGNNQPVYWGVDDCEKALAMLIEKGAGKDSEPQNVGEGIIVASVLDPFGNVFGIIQNPHFKIED